MPFKIAHIADVHWRGLNRHEEYRKVFTDLFNELRDEKIDAILVAGDIVHSKTQGISPELIDHLNWWFREMDSIAPTYITLGNHDGLIHNKDRQDAITPVINALNLPRTQLFKKSGTYDTHMKGVTLGVFSCFDEENWDSVKPRGEISIAVFHGSVSGALSDSDYNLESETGIDRFRGFDFGLFGDIHKFQHIGGNSRFVYPGSTIQQNYGEQLDKGAVLWEISGKDKFSNKRIILSNPHPFVTVEWQGSAQETVLACKGIKKGARFRISAKDRVTQEEIKHISSLLKEDYDAHEIVWKLESEQGQVDSGIKTYENKGIDLRQVQSHRQLLRDYFKNIPDDDLDTMTVKVSDALARIEPEDVGRNIKWTLDEMRWSNTFAYGKDNVINFTENTGIVGLFGKNRMGKSSIPGTLMYGLFNATDRGSIKNIHIVNTRKGFCNVEVDITANGKCYRVERQTTKHTSKKGEVSAATHLNLYQLEGGEYIDMSGEQRRDSDKILKSIIGIPEDFLLTSFASQGEMNTFISQKGTSRKYNLGRFLDLNLLDKLHQKFKEESVEIKGALRSSPERDFDSLIEECKKNIGALEIEISEMKVEKDSQDRKARILEEKLKNLGEDIVTQDELDDCLSRSSSLDESIRNNVESIRGFKDDLEKIDEKIRKINEIRQNFPIESVKEKLTESKQLESKSVGIRHTVDKEKLILKEQEQSVKRLEEVPCGESFPTCKFIRDSITNKKLMEGQKKKIDELKSELSFVLGQLGKAQVEVLEERLKKYEDMISMSSRLNSNREALTAKIDLFESRLTTMRSEKVTVDAKASELQVRLASSGSHGEATEYRRTISQITDKVSGFEKSINDKSVKVGILQERISNLENEKVNFLSLKTRWALQDRLIRAYNKDGIPMMILASELPVINEEIAKILQGIAGFTVRLETDDSGSDLEIVLDYGDSRRPIELGSGMEKMISSLAIRVALINVSSLPKSDILIIDEGFGALDEQNVEACSRLLHSLKRFFKTILVISHVDAIKDAVDSSIEITQAGADAHVSAC